MNIILCRSGAEVLRFNMVWGEDPTDLAGVKDPGRAVGGGVVS